METIRVRMSSWSTILRVNVQRPDHRTKSAQGVYVATQLRGPLERVAERVNVTVEVLKRHYNQPTKIEEVEERRRQFLTKLDFSQDGDFE